MGMHFDFDTMTDRRNTNCGKWDTMDKKYGRKDMIHLGVADMDLSLIHIWRVRHRRTSFC